MGVPPSRVVALTDDEILGRCHPLYSKGEMVAVEWESEEAQRMGCPELERVRERYLSDGMAIGPRAFVEKVFESGCGAFSAKRETGARKANRE